MKGLSSEPLKNKFLKVPARNFYLITRFSIFSVATTAAVS